MRVAWNETERKGVSGRHCSSLVPAVSFSLTVVVDFSLRTRF